MSEKVKIKIARNVVHLPAIALRGLVVFPNNVVHFEVGRTKSIAAIEAAMHNNSSVFLVAQREMDVEEPALRDLYGYGVIAEIKQVLRVSDDLVKVLVEGKYRAKLTDLDTTGDFLLASVRPAPVRVGKTEDAVEIEALLRALKSSFDEYLGMNPRLAKDVVFTIVSSTDPEFLSEYMPANLLFRYEDKQAVMDEGTLNGRLKKLVEMLRRECQVMKIEKEIAEKVNESMDKNQRDYYLHEQLHIISDELGEGDDTHAEADEYRRRITELHLAEDSEKKLLKEVDRLSKMQGSNQEATVIRTYLDTCLDLPWNSYTEDDLDINRAQQILDRDHYGLKKVKDRILETLAVRKLAPDVKAQIICLVGPPGVGKTSLGKSIARATGRSFVRASLGGMRDEAEIRGHRRTYIGSMPGKIIKGMKKAATSNPLFLLDEIDKKVGFANTVVFLTSTGYFKGEAKESPIYNIPSGEFYPRRAVSLLNVYLMALYGQGDWVIGYQNRQIFLNRKLIKERDIDADEMRNRAASFLIQMTGVQDVYTSQRLLLSNGTDRVAAMRNGYYPKLSGDLVLDLCPGWEVVYEDANDTREYVRVNAVPAPCFILAHDVKPVRITSPVRATAIAPTVSRLLRIRSPNGSADAPLSEIQY